MAWRARILLTVVAVASLFAFVTPAFAYSESSSTVDPADTPSWACPTCHGLESGYTSPSVAPTRRGVHGAFTTDTDRCAACHRVHSAVSPLLLPTTTAVDLCYTCHDGTGGGGVYGVIKRRTGTDPAGHTIGDTTPTVPGGDPAGGSVSRSFSGVGGGLSCVDCHDPHNGTNQTVQAFVGDRIRSIYDTTSATPTNRLLRNNPGSAVTTVATYGTEWCLACHKGSGNGHSVGSLASTTPVDYSHVVRVSTYSTHTLDAATGPLGGNNFGYVMPAGSNRTRPICMQCHEDSRSIGNVASQTIDITEAFSPSVDGTTTGNPRFQNFPHETVNATMLVEYDPLASNPVDTLCTNCHDVATSSRVH